MQKPIRFIDLVDTLRDPMVAEAVAVVAPDAPDAPDAAEAVEAYLLVDVHSPVPDALVDLPRPSCPVIGRARGAFQTLPDCVDLIVESDAECARVVAAIQAQPVAAAVLMQVLRHNEFASVNDGLLAESLAYSTLQHSAGFQRWQQRQVLKEPAATDANLVKVQRDAQRLLVQLNRPAKHNAYSKAMRDELCDALTVALMDDSITHVVLTGTGPSFCAGGDLAEFGQARDAGIAHHSRVTRSAGAMLHRLGQRLGGDLQVKVQGACIGAGIELSAFAPYIVAQANTVFQLPEVGFGLIPGAGGTVSVLQRIGRRRTAFMALTAAKITAPQALRWGLIDELIEPTAG